jgi:biopolymer transport protein ExbB
MNIAADIWRYWSSGGLVMGPLALVSVGIWFYFFRTGHALRSVSAVSRAFEQQVADDIGVRPIEAVLADLRIRPGVLAAAVAHMLDAPRRGDVPTDAYARYREAVVVRLSRDVVVMAALTAAAPLLGLLGTVMGMIATFRAVGGGTGDTAARVSFGISQALIATQFGLMIAILGCVGVARLRRRLDRVETRLAVCRSLVLAALVRRHAAPGDSNAQVQP